MQTHTSFKDKWEKSGDDFFADLLNESSEITRWVLGRNGFKSFDELRVFLEQKKNILDAGCGNGRVTNLFASLSSTKITGIDFSSAIVARRNLKNRTNVTIKEADLLSDLSHLGIFDFIYCQEVLHHTGDARKGFENLTEILAPEGEIAIYVYKKKAPIREFVDDFIRDQIKNLSYEDALAVCSGLTELGKSLSEANLRVNVPSVPVLGIAEGEYDVQRFLYHFFVKCFWNPGLSRKENDVINYDWYHPEDCTRHTLDEVREWYRSKNLTIMHECEDHYGITMIGKK